MNGYAYAFYSACEAPDKPRAPHSTTPWSLQTEINRPPPYTLAYQQTPDIPATTRRLNQHVERYIGFL
ncbi:hypothetical protein BCIN_12g03510 [Botrytis cinerea B05.10]|uniref:Uncharacterized protein n=1 Tax=Botryotinia fuckeliana (strain B05.10) TaxID=332648 RepID=A0A384JZ51_BOTFB|nr:hypothetical protein BCIN_12g03510 [Botrytis cinerea B05.10]ATZ55791.1 hypothetical protein BCIN_12g03510 [Botrytis cinerea B05.10]